MPDRTQRLVFRLTLLFSLLFGFGLAAASATTITLSAAQIPNIQAGAGTYELRIWLDRTMVDSLGVTYPGGAVDSPNGFKRVSCALASTTVTCDTFQLASTIDAQEGATAKYAAKLYRNNAPLLLYNKPFALPASLGASVTWEQVWRYNNTAPMRVPDTEYYTKNQVNALYAGSIFASPATTTSRGVAKSSVSAADPVFVETTDPRVSPATTTSRGIGKTSVAVADPIFVETSDLRVPTALQRAALSGTSGSPSGSNRYVTNADPRLSAPPATFSADVTSSPYLALGDGVTDDTAAIQAAITAVGAAGGGVVYFPATANCYPVTALTVASNYVRLLGEGWASRICKSTATGNTLTFSNGLSGMTLLEDTTYLTGVGAENLRFEPLVTRTSGSEIVAYRYNKLYLNNLVIQGDLYQGIQLGRVSDITIDTFISQLRMRQFKFGIKMTNVIDCFADSLALDKFDQTDNTYSVWLSGLTSGLSATNWELVNSKYATVGPTGNNVYALYMKNDTGLTGAILLANKFTNCYFDSHTRGLWGEDGTGNNFSNCWFSDVGVGTGGTPGIGVNIIAGTDWNFENCYAMNNGGPGVYIGGFGSVSWIGGGIAGNNQQGYPNSDPLSAGIWLQQGAGGFARIIGTSINKNLGIFPSNLQQWGIWISNSGGGFEITSNYLTGNHTGAINNLAGVTTSQRVHHNEGFVTENSGNDSIASAATSVVVAHGLSYTPAAGQIVITRTTNTTNNVFYYVDTIGATNFTVHTSGDPGASGFGFGWSVKIQ